MFDDLDKFIESLLDTGNGELHFGKEPDFSIPDYENYYAAENLYELGELVHLAGKGVRSAQAQLRLLAEAAYETDSLESHKNDMRIATLFFDPKNIALQVRAMSENWSVEMIEKTLG